MKLNPEKAVRLGIFFFYDPDGVVDDYVTYFLDDLLKSLNGLIIVCNGELTEDGRRKFRHYTENLIIRENQGFDVWAYKTALESIGWNTLRTYDEVILANHTIMGPVYPLKDMFQKMALRDVDFWGITKYPKSDNDPFGCCQYGYIPEHIQSHFIVYRNSLLNTEELKQYWDKIPPIESYEQSIGFHETVFTKHFSDQGFLWDVYVNTDEYEGFTDNPLIHYAKNLLAEKKCPVFKRRSFFQDYDYVLGNTTGQSALELYQFLKQNQLYDVNLLWDNLLRTCHQSDLVKNLGLTYTLSTQHYDPKTAEEIVKTRKIALIMHLYFEDLLEVSYQWATAIPPETDVYITTNTTEKKQAIEQVFQDLACSHFEVRLIENRGRDVSSLLVGTADAIKHYDYVCFVHDKKTVQIKPASLGESFAYKCFSNTLYNRAFVYNVLETFEKNPRLGILSPPIPNHGSFFPPTNLEWCDNFENTKQLAEELKITVPMAHSKPPIAPLGTFFWFRPNALKPLYKKAWTYEDFPPEPNKTDGTILHAIERLYPFSAQQAGYYPAVVMSDHFARIEYTNLNHYIRKLDGTIRELYPKTSLKWQLKDRFFKLFKR